MTELDVGILKQEVLSLLVSAQYGLTEYELLNDYRKFNSNKDFPYRDLGYPTLISLLRSWTDVCRVQHQGNNGAIKILAVEEENTKHILSMVRGQRQNKSRRRRGGRGGGRNRGRGGRGGGDEGRNGGRYDRGARFSQATFNSNYSQSGGGNGRGASNGRIAYNNNRSERSTIPPRLAMAQSNQNSRNKPNVSAPPRFAKQQIRAHITGFTQPLMSSYDSRQSTNSHLFDDRRVINNSTSLKITVNNNTNNNRNNNANEINNDHQYSSDTAFRFADYELNEDEEQYDEEEDEDKEEEVINNLQTLLTEYSHGVRLLVLDELYQNKFGKSLLNELKITNILLLQDFVDDFASISRHGEENGSCDHIITLKDPKQVAQTQAQLLQQITDSGIVPKHFHYANNVFSYISDPRFQGFISDIDKNEHCLHVQPVRYQEHIETLMEELDSYYSSTISNSLIIKNIETGLSCVTKYDGIYHRVFIKESDLYKCVIIYVDYGTTEEINKDEQQFKYLLKHFAELPCMAIACRLDDIRFIPDDDQWLPDTYNELYALCKDGPFFIEPTSCVNGLLSIKILDADGRCLNDIVVELKLAVKISAPPPNQPSIQHYEQQQQSAPKPAALTFDFLNNAAQCPLPESGPPTPEDNTTNSNFQLSENISFQTTNDSSNGQYQCKLIQIDKDTTFYLIRYIPNNKPYIPCFDLTRLLHQGESDILSETLLARIRLNQTTEYRTVFDFIKQTNPKECLHIHQNLLFLFELTSVIQYIGQLDQIKYHSLIETLQQQIDASNEPNYWNNVYDCYKRPSSTAPTLSVQSSNRTDTERCNELLARRNLLCNILRTSDTNECAVELVSIENELQQLVEKMRSGVTSQQNNNHSLTPPPGFITPVTISPFDKSDKLKDLMQRCKTLINTILILDDYVHINDNITEYIQNSLPFLNSGKNSTHDEQLHKQYSELLTNLTVIVNDLRQRLPIGINI